MADKHHGQVGAIDGPGEAGRKGGHDGGGHGGGHHHDAGKPGAGQGSTPKPSPTTGTSPSPATTPPSSGSTPAPAPSSTPSPSDNYSPSEPEEEGDSGESPLAQILQQVEELQKQMQQSDPQSPESQSMQQQLTQLLQALEELLGGTGNAGGGATGNMAMGSGVGGGAAGGNKGGESGGQSTSATGTTPGGKSYDGSNTNVSSGTVQSNAQAVAKVAQEKGVDPVTAVATMLTESGGNNKAVGDGGTSFGLFQLHQGGELGNMSPESAFDPTNNANTALSEFASVQKSTGLTGGALAAAAQRPANPGAYAAEVNGNMAKARQLLGMS